MNGNKRRIDLVGTSALGLTILFWGIVPVFLRSFVGEIDGWTANGVRYGVSALFWIGPLALWLRRGVIQPRHVRAAWPTVAVNVAGQTLWAWTPYYLEAGMLAFMVRSATVFAVIFSFIAFPHERPLIRSVGFWVGLLMMAFGFVGISYLGEEIPQGATLIGLALVLTCGLFWGLYGVAVRLSFPDLAVHHAFSLICVLTAVPIVMMMGLGSPSDLGAMSAWRISMVVLSGFLGIAFGHVTYYLAMKHVGVAIASSSNLVTPLIAGTVAYFALGETFTLGQSLAGGVLLAGAGFLITAQVHVVVPD